MRIIIVGQGKLIYYLARQFLAKKHSCTIVMADAAEARELSQRIEASVIVGSGTDRQILENAGARRADVVLALTPEDEDNLVICRLAGTFQIPRTIAFVNDPDNEDVFHKLDVSVAISATRILSTILQEETGFEQLTEMMSLGEGKVTVSEAILRENSSAANIRIEDLGLPEGALIGGIIRKGDIIVPRGTTQLQIGDRLILIASTDCLEQVMKICGGDVD